MRALIYISLVWIGAQASANPVLPTTAFCEIALRAARASTREIGPFDVAALYAAYRAYKTEGHRNIRTDSDVRDRDLAPRGLLAFSRPPGSLPGVEIVAKEFIGAEEIARAVGVLRGRIDSTGLPLLEELRALYPPARASELLRLGTWTAMTVLPLMTSGQDIDFVHAPLTIAASYLNDVRRRRAREEKFGVPRLDGQLAILDRALAEAAELAPEARRPVLSVVRGTARIDLATHKVLFEREEADLSRSDFRTLVASARPLEHRWTDFDRIYGADREILVESVVFTENVAPAPRLRWMIFVRSGRPPGGE